MIRLVLAALVVLLLVGGVYLALAIVQTVRRAAWPGDSPQYRNHLGMARWIERQLHDDMVQVTIPDDQKRAAQQLLEQFYGERQIGEGE